MLGIKIVPNDLLNIGQVWIFETEKCIWLRFSFYNNMGSIHGWIFKICICIIIRIHISMRLMTSAWTVTRSRDWNNNWKCKHFTLASMLENIATWIGIDVENTEEMYTHIYTINVERNLCKYLQWVGFSLRLRFHRLRRRCRCMRTAVYSICLSIPVVKKKSKHHI